MRFNGISELASLAILLGFVSLAACTQKTSALGSFVSSGSSGASSTANPPGSTPAPNPTPSGTPSSTATPTPAPTSSPTPVHVVGNCGQLSGVGVWDNITPSGVDLSTYGVNKVLVDPNNSSHVFIGTSNSGIFKSTDCGATWVHINTGTLGSNIDKGGTAPIMDPSNSNILYTYSLYGMNGFFKSTDGGVNWKQVLTPNIQAVAPYGGFVSGIDMDPSNTQHLLISFHAACSAPATPECYGETFDGGTTWTVRNADPSWGGGEGTGIQFLDSDHWLYASSSNPTGLFISVDHGASWQTIPGGSVAHGQGQIYRAGGGVYYLASADGVLYSKDNGSSWTLLPNSGQLIKGLTSDGTTLFASQSFPYNPPDRPGPFQPFESALLNSPLSWSKYSSPMMANGGDTLEYDRDHHILYSADLWVGLYRTVTK